MTLRQIAGLVCLVCGIGLLPAPFAVAAVPEAIFTPECGGVVAGKEGEREVSAGRILRADPLIIALGGSITTADSAYVAGFLRSVLPILLDLVGDAGTPDTLRFTHIFGNSWNPFTRHLSMVPLSDGPGFDDDADGSVDEDPSDGVDNDRDGRIDEDLATSPQWDSAFVHELTHVFTAPGVSGFEGTWISEGIAEAARYFVGETMKREHPERPMSDARWPVHIAEADPYDGAGCQVGGGAGWYPDRANGEVAYRCAAAAVLIPCLAEIALGRSAPHPLRRLMDALRAEPASYGSIARAANRAWSSPIDGTFPPGRWVESRSIAYGAVRSDGAFLAVLPNDPETAVNPSRLQLFAFRVRFGRYYERLIASGRMTFTGANGDSYESRSSDGVSPVPVMPPGAYRVDAEASTPWPEAPLVDGHNWIIITSSGRPALSSIDGTAIIFADSTAMPIDLPDATVNGRSLERVPGGLLVAPGSGSLGDRMLTVVSGGRVVGSVTIPGDFSRTVVMNVSRTYRKGTVSWEPYSPLPGDSITVRFDRSDSALPPDGETVSVSVIDSTRAVHSRTQMSRLPGYDDVWTCRVGIPAGFGWLSLLFETGTDAHDGELGWLGHEVFPLVQGETAVCGAAVGGRNLLVDICGRIDEDRLVIQYEGAAPARSWIDSPDRPVREGPGSCRVTFPLLEHAGLLRIVVRDPGGDRVLLLMRLGPELQVRRLACGLPYPNPTAGEIRCGIEVDAPAMASLRVYDVAGRLVDGPRVSPLFSGASTFQWSATGLSAGIYFLKMTAGRESAVRKILIIPGP